MSSSSPPRRDRRATLLLLLVTAMVAGPCAGPPAASAAVPLPVVAVIPGDQQTSMVVDLGAGTKPAEKVTLTLAGVPQRATVTPALADQMVAALVVDASEAGAAALPGWLSAAARFALELPATARTAVVADTDPPRVVAPPKPGAIGVVGALNTVRPAGRRHTSDALTLAADQIRAGAADSRLLMLYTTSPDAGGESAAALSARLTAAGAMLVVVGAAAGNAYWSGVSQATGGFFAPASVPVVVPALDQVATTLRARHRVTFPTPQNRPAAVSISVDAGDLTLTADTVVPADAAPAARPASDSGTLWWAFLLTVLLAVTAAAAGAAVLLWRQAGRPRPQAAPPPVVARGRASVPGPRPPHHT